MADNLCRLLIFCTLYVCAFVFCVAGKVCVNKDCSDPISTCKVKKDFKTENVQLLVGDEVDVISRSDDGSISEFEIGDVRGFVPSSHLREVTLFAEEESLVHVSDEEDNEDEGSYDEGIPHGEIDPDRQFEDHMPFDGDPEYGSPNQEEMLRKKIRKGKNNQNENEMKKTETGKMKSMEETKADSKQLQTDVSGENGDSSSESKADDVDRLKEALKSEEKDLLKTLEMKASIDDVSNLQNVDKPPSGRLEEEGKSTDRKNSSEKTNTHEIPNAESTDSKTITKAEKELPATNDKTKNEETIFSDGFNAHQTFSAKQMDLFREEMQKLPNFKIIKQKHVKDYLNDNYKGQNVDDEILKRVEEFITNDLITQLQEPGNPLMEMMTNYDPKDLPGWAEFQSQEAKKGKDGEITKEEDDKKEKDAPIDYSEHPEFLAIKKRHVSHYLKTNYGGEEGNPQISEMVNKLITDDLLRQLKLPGSPLHAELMQRINNNKAAAVKSTDEQKLQPEKDQREEQITEKKVNVQKASSTDQLSSLLNDERSTHISKQLTKDENLERTEKDQSNFEMQDKLEQQQTGSSDGGSATNNETDSKQSFGVPNESPKQDVSNQLQKDSNEVKEQIRGIKIISDNIEMKGEGVPEAADVGEKAKPVPENTDMEKETSEVTPSTSLREQTVKPIPPAGGSVTPSTVDDTDENPRAPSITTESVDSGVLNAFLPSPPPDSESPKADESESQASPQKKETEADNKITMKSIKNAFKSRFNAFASKLLKSNEDQGTDAKKLAEEENADSKKDSGHKSGSMENLLEDTNEPKDENEKDTKTDKDVDSKTDLLFEASNLAVDGDPENSTQKDVETDKNVEHQEMLRPAPTLSSPLEIGDSRDPLKEEPSKDANGTNNEKLESEEQVQEVWKHPSEEEYIKEGKSGSNGDKEDDSILKSNQEPTGPPEPLEGDSKDTTSDAVSKSTDGNDTREHTEAEKETVEDDTAEKRPVEELSPTNIEAKGESKEDDTAEIKVGLDADEKQEDIKNVEDVAESNVVSESSSQSLTQNSRQLLQVDEGGNIESSSPENYTSDSNTSKKENSLLDSGHDSNTSQTQSTEEQGISKEVPVEDQKVVDEDSTQIDDSSIEADNEKKSSASEAQQDSSSDPTSVVTEDSEISIKEGDEAKENLEDSLSRDDLLERCHNDPSSPACEKLQGIKVFRGSHKTEEPTPDQEDIGKLDRAWRNLMKIMQRIKLMKLSLVRLFHGPLSVLGLHDLSHWFHDLVDQTSPEIVTIIVCCMILIVVLVMKWVFTEKTVHVGASLYDINKMKQSQQRIIRENSQNLENEIRELRDKLTQKDEKVNSGDVVVKDLEKKLKSLRNQFEKQEKLLTSVRQEIEDGKSEQKRLHELIDDKEKEIQQADNVAIRHQTEIERQTEITENLNTRLEKVVEELDLKDGVVLEMQEKIGALHVELENMEMQSRQIEKEKTEANERCDEMEEKLKMKDEENAKLQDEIDEKENEIEVLHECMAQIHNGKLEGEAVDDFETPEDDPDIKEQLKTERLKQILESTQSLADLRKCEKEKESFQEGYLEELEKRENAEAKVKELQSEVDTLSKDAQTYRTSATEIQIKLDTLQHYFRQQETELHRKLSSEEQLRQDYQRKYEAVVGQSTSAVEEASSLRSQIEDLKNEIKEIERSFKDKESGTEREIHDIWIKFRQANRDAEEMKRERDIYRKRLLEAETTKRRTSPVSSAGLERSRDSPAGSDEGRPQSPLSQRSSVSGLPNFVGPRPPFGMIPPPPQSMFGPGGMQIGGPLPMGPMPPRPSPFGPMAPRPPMMVGPQNPMSVPQSTMSGPQNPMTVSQNTISGPQNPMIVPQNTMPVQQSTMSGPQNPMTVSQNTMSGPQNPMIVPQNTMATPQNPMNGPQNPVPGLPNLSGVAPTSIHGPSSMTGPLKYNNVPFSNAGASSGQPGFSSNTSASQFPSQSNAQNYVMSSTENSKPSLARTSSQKSLSSNSGITGSNRGQLVNPSAPRGFGPTSSQTPFQSTPINSPNLQQQSVQHQSPIPNDSTSGQSMQNNQIRRQRLPRNPASNDLV